MATCKLVFGPKDSGPHGLFGGLERGRERKDGESLGRSRQSPVEERGAFEAARRGRRELSRRYAPLLVVRGRDPRASETPPRNEAAASLNSKVNETSPPWSSLVSTKLTSAGVEKGGAQGDRMAGFQPKGDGPSDPMWQCPSTPKVTFGSRLHPSTKQAANRHAEEYVRNEHEKGACGWHPCCEFEWDKSWSWHAEPEMGTSRSSLAM